MTRAIDLIEVAPPPLELADELPSISGAELEERIAALKAAVDADWIVVYGDREHGANLIFLTNLDPRFEEALFVIGPDTRTLLLGKEDVGYVPIVPIDVDVVLCPTFSLMGIDRGGGPTFEQALREIGVGDGARIGVVGWKALHSDEWNGRRPAIFAPAFFVDTLRDLAGESGSVFDATTALTSPRSGLRAFASADQIAIFEWGAARCSAWVHAIIGAARPGASEHDAFRAADWTGRAAQPASRVRSRARRRGRSAQPVHATARAWGRRGGLHRPVGRQLCARRPGRRLGRRPHGCERGLPGTAGRSRTGGRSPPGMRRSPSVSPAGRCSPR